MSQAPPISDARPAQVVLFGPPQAGKTALLGALGQVAQTHPDLLHGQLRDPAGSLQTQRRRLYERAALPSVPEVAFAFQPSEGEAVAGVMTEVDGDLAHQQLLPRRPQQPEPPAIPALDRADVLLLALDLTEPDEERQQRLSDLARFLRELELRRSRRAEVGGLPVFVVLTKGDALAAPGDGVVEWMEKLENAKRQVRQRLVQLMQTGTPRPTSFGRLDLAVWVSAAWFPALNGAPARPEPHGVAELFRQALTQAAGYRGRRQRSQHFLLGTLAVAAGLLAVLGLLAFALLGGVADAPPSELERKVMAWSRKEGSQTLALRLRGLPPTLERRLKQLQDFEKDPEFAALPESLRELVGSRRQELERYIAYLKKLLEARSPALARSDAELDAAEKELRETLALPLPSWIDTDAGKLHQQRLADIRRYRDQVRVAEEWYRQQRKEALDLWTFTVPPRQAGLINWRRWNDEVATFLSRPNVPPPGVLSLPANSLVTQQTILNHERVTGAREATLNARELLQSLRNITAALGIVEAGPDRPAVLVLPPTGFSIDDAKSRLERLRMAYPDHELEFVLRHVADAARPAVLQAARTSLDYLFPAGREVVLQQFLKAPGDTPPQRWSAVAEWLAGEPEELKAWRRLDLLLGALLQATPQDHAAQLQSFLAKKELPLTLERLVVEVSDDAPVRIPEGSALMLTHRQQTHRFALAEDGKVRDAQNRLTRYTFEADRLKLPYKPGDAFQAEIALPDGDLLTWDQPRTAAFAFDALNQPPRLHRKGQQGVALRDVVLHVRPADGLPAVPELLPSTP